MPDWRIMGAAGACLVAALGTGTGAAAQDKPSQTPVLEVEPGSVHEVICHLAMWRGDSVSPNTGTAMLYRRQYLLTAGHNVMEGWNRLRRIDVRCGVTDAKSSPVQQELDPWQVQRASGFTALRGFPKRRDFGVIRLDTPIDTRVQVTLTEKAPRFPDRPQAVSGETVCLYGYPGGDLDDGYTLYEGCRELTGPAWFREGAMYNLQTHTSNSGGPVLRRIDDTRQELVAVHIQPSAGRLANRAFIAEVERLIRELDARAAERGLK